MFIIYQITNKVNGKRYIGKTGKSLEQRWGEHASNAFWNTQRASSYFYCAIRKHGPNSFEIKEIDKTEDRDVVDYLESFWIAALRTYDRRYGYNGTLGGDGGSPTEETRAKISASLIGRPGHPSTPEINAKISAANKGRKPSKSAIENARLTRLGKPPSWMNSPRREEILAKLRLSNIGRTFSEETRLKMSIAAKKRCAN